MINRSFAMLLALCAMTPAAAAETWTEIGFYIFGAELEGTTRLDTVTSDIDIPFDDIVENLDMGFMGYIEHRRDRWSFFGDINYLDVSADDSSTNDGQLEVDVDVGLEQAVLEAFVGYSVLEPRPDSDMGLDVYAGLRHSMLETSLGSDASLLGRTNSRLREDDEDWTDTVVGLRLRFGDRDGWTSSFRVDVGDGSDSSSEQFMALVGYGTDSEWTFFGGYRYLNLEYDKDGDTGLGIDIDYKGPMLGAALRL